MRAIKAVSVVYLIAIAVALAGVVPASRVTVKAAGPDDINAPKKNGQQIFRYDTFGDEQLWTDVLQMPEAISKVSPATALSVGLKVDVDALPPGVIAALKAGLVDLNSPATTIALLQLNAVVGVKGQVNEAGELTKIGVTCALCHSTVDDSFMPGVGRRLDGWANRDLDVGKIVSLSPVLDEPTKLDFQTWGPGRYDPRHHYFNGASIVPLNPSLPLEIPPIYGLKGVGFETVTADGPISYWNAYVGVSQMGGHGNFIDPRIGISITQTPPDLVTPKLADLLAYQLSLQPPTPEKGSFDVLAAARGKDLFRGQAQCSTCHQQPNFTDVLSGPDKNIPFLHDPSEVGTDAGYAMRTATQKYRTTPLRALAFHAPYFHDGSAADLLAVVNHYDTLFQLHLTDAQKADLVEYLKSL